jgi:ribose/xylose/arabinose/galactoside ABC-type transport system permease subunit
VTTTAPAEDAAAAQPDERLAYRGPIQRLLIRPEIGALIGAAAIWTFFWAVTDIFGTVAGANNYLDVSATLGIMSIAVALLMIGGEFDLSSGAMTGATGMLVVLLVKETGEFGGAGFPAVVAIPLTLAFALAIGWANGTMVEKTALPSFIVTLGTFFILRGAKLGFAKLFTDKVIVEGLDNAPDYGFWENIFGAVWIRNDHVWDDFLGGRDVVYGVLLAVGAALLIFGLLDLIFQRRDTLNASGLPLAVGGSVAAVIGLIALTVTDGVSANWLWGVVLVVGGAIGLYGLGTWRYEGNPESSGSVDLGGARGRSVLIGVGAIALGIVLGLVIDSDSQTELGFLLTVQGFRAIAYVGLVITGIVLLLGAARDAGKTSPRTQLVITSIAAASITVLAFVIQVQADSRKFRAEFFAILLGAAFAILMMGVLRWLFVERRTAEASTERKGRMIALTGLTIAFIGVAIRLLWSTTIENETLPGQIRWRVSVLYFLLFAVAASYLLLKTKFGSWTFAVGGNASAARQVGVPAARTKTTLFMLVAGAGWLAGMLIAFRLNSVQANVGDGQEFFYIIAAVVGGNLLTGGYGSVIGASIGAVIMAMSFQGIPFAGWNSDWRFLFVGAILLLAVLVNNYVRSKAEASS